MSADTFAARLAEAVRAVPHADDCWCSRSEEERAIGPCACYEQRDARIARGIAAALEAARTGTPAGTWVAVLDAALTAFIAAAQDGP